MKFTTPQDLPDADGNVHQYTDVSLTLTIVHQVEANGTTLDTATLHTVPARFDENGKVHHNSLFTRDASFSFASDQQPGDDVISQARQQMRDAITVVMRSLGV
jgi:hypothetical protein